MNNRHVRMQRTSGITIEIFSKKFFRKKKDFPGESGPIFLKKFFLEKVKNFIPKSFSWTKRNILTKKFLTKSKMCDIMTLS